MRKATLTRKTGETEITVTVNLDGTGRHRIHTGVGFLDHMLQQIAVHGLFDLEIEAQGDLEVDAHHTVEDTALTLGAACRQALGDRKGIIRTGDAFVPMDETLCQVVVDLSGRPYAVFTGAWTGSSVGGLPVTLMEHFFQSLAVSLEANLHTRILYGRDDHHKAEALFKAFARALDAAVRIDPRRKDTIPSTKGTL
jgi:imidazoleglycerol-phosphate dehydratase